MKNLVSIILVLALTGCGTYGEPLFLAKIYDNADVCQRNPHIGYCGASGGRTYIYNNGNNQIGYIKK